MADGHFPGSELSGFSDLYSTPECVSFYVHRMSHARDSSYLQKLRMVRLGIRSQTRMDFLSRIAHATSLRRLRAEHLKSTSSICPHPLIYRNRKLKRRDALNALSHRDSFTSNIKCFKDTCQSTLLTSSYPISCIPVVTIHKICG